MNDRLEKIAETVHNAWRLEKIKQGENHSDMVPYAELAENVKEYNRVTVRAVMKAIQGLHQDWIPASERLPDEPKEGQGIKEYIVTIDGAFESTTLSYLGRDQWRDDDGNWYKVLAWMPKPEPYKPELSRLMGAGERSR